MPSICICGRGAVCGFTPLSDDALNRTEKFLDGNATSINANTAREMLDEIKWLRSANDQLTAERDAARREVEGMSVVVEAAKVWREEYRQWLLAPQIAFATGRHVLPANDGRLAIAIDAYRAALDTPGDKALGDG